jgi:ligand-binding sensor protein
MGLPEQNRSSNDMPQIPYRLEAGLNDFSEWIVVLIGLL